MEQTADILELGGCPEPVKELVPARWPNSHTQYVFRILWRLRELQSGIILYNRVTGQAGRQYP